MIGSSPSAFFDEERRQLYEEIKPYYPNPFRASTTISMNGPRS